MRRSRRNIEVAVLNARVDELLLMSFEVLGILKRTAAEEEDFDVFIELGWVCHGAVVKSFQV